MRKDDNYIGCSRCGASMLYKFRNTGWVCIQCGSEYIKVGDEYTICVKDLDEDKLKKAREIVEEAL